MAQNSTIKPIIIKVLIPLEQLIQSMSQSEKRYFRITSRLSGRKDATCIKLFDILDHQKTEKLKSLRRHLPVTRHNLFKMLVSSLADFHRNNSPYATLSSELNNLHILYQRGLYNSCLKKIDKCISNAIGIESFSLALEFLSLKRKVVIASRPMDQASLAELGQQELTMLRQLGIMHAYWNSMMNLREEDPVLRSIPSKALPVQARIVRLHGDFTRHYVNGDTTEALDSIQKLVELIESDTTGPQETRPYLVILSNQLELFIRLRKWNQTKELLQKIRVIQRTFANQAFTTHNIRLTSRIYNLELEYYRDTHQWKAAKELSIQINELLEADTSIFPSEYLLLFNYQFANVYFHLKDYKTTLKFVNLIQNGDFKKARPDILMYSRLLNMVVHFELGNFTLLEYLISNSRRLVIKDKALAGFQARITGLLGALPTATVSQKKKLLRNAQEYLDSGTEEIAEALDYLDLRKWVAEKLSA